MTVSNDELSKPQPTEVLPGSFWESFQESIRKELQEVVWEGFACFTVSRSFGGGLKMRSGLLGPA